MDKLIQETIETAGASSKPKMPKMQQHLPRNLKGLATNKYGGTQLTSFRGFRGQSYGAARKGHRYTSLELERFAHERGLKVTSSSKECVK